jgi:hypothetical protein
MHWRSSTEPLGATGRPRPRPGRAPCCAALLGLALLGATCEEQDYTAPERLVLANAGPFEPVWLELAQPYRGLSTLDYRVVNTGTTEARFGLYAAVWYDTTADDGAPVRIESTATRVTEPLAPTGETTGRFFETELGLGERVHVEFLCWAAEGETPPPCSGTLDLTLLLRQVECRSDSDCSAGEACDTARGRCRTAEETDSACQAAQAPWSSHAPGLTALALLLTLASVARRRP